MRILISGASGFVGAPLSTHLKAQGHEVISLVRHPTSDPKAILWNPEEKKADSSSFNGFDAVIHLAGDPLSFSRWSPAKKEKIFQSRVEGTRFLSSLLSSVKKPPRIFIAASAVGIYGDRGEEMLDESSSLGENFLSHVCREWEAAVWPLENLGVRVAKTRFGMVLGRHGGALSKMLPIYRWGLGSTLGNGKQWMSWIALPDLISAMSHVLTNNLKGPINFVSPHAARQKAFSKTLAHLLKRPHVGKIPACILRMYLGTVADELILASAHVTPSKLLASGFSFKYPMLEDALIDCLYIKDHPTYCAKT